MLDPRRLATDEERERLYAAKNRGGCCAACGRTLVADEPVYFERFVFWQVGPTRLTTQAPVGRECASPEALARTTGQEPERCAGCGRGLFYRKPCQSPSTGLLDEVPRARETCRPQVGGAGRSMSRRPIATVRVLGLPDVHPDAVRIEVECPASTTGLTSVPASPGPGQGLALLVTAAVFAHEERCDGACDTSEAHALGSPTARQETERR